MHRLYRAAISLLLSMSIGLVRYCKESTTLQFNLASTCTIGITGAYNSTGIKETWFQLMRPFYALNYIPVNLELLH